MCKATTVDPMMKVRAAAGPSVFRNLLALGLGLLPPCVFVLVARASQGRGFTVDEMVAYPLIVGGGSLVAILALHRFLCGEPLTTLNPRPGSLARDAIVGMGLSVAFFVLVLATQPLLTRLVAPHRNVEGLTLIRGLLQSPWLMLIWFGPVLWIGVAAFEEVARVFCILRLRAIWPGITGCWTAVVVSSIGFGLMHYYQGPSGTISTGLIGLLSAVYYVRRGRIWPLVIGHALYDAYSIGVAMVLVARATA